MRTQVWFEMDDVKRDMYGGGEWTPLWVYDVSHQGEMFASPYEEEIYRIRTLFAPLTNKAALFERWLDLDSDGVYPCVDHGRYCRPGVYYLDSRDGVEGGEFTVFSYSTVSGKTCELQINQDFVSALKLVPQDSCWVRPCEDDCVGIRIIKNDDGKVCRVEVRTEYLRDYLCARGMGLYLEEFRHRQVNDVDGHPVCWKDSPLIERRVLHDGNGVYEWKGWMFKHTDKHQWKDVNSVNTEVLAGSQYYRIEGQLWKQLWVNPTSKSERVAGDDLEFEYYVSPNGEKHLISPLDDDEFGHVYLFFRIELEKHVLSAGARITWEARDVFSVVFPSGQRTLFGISKSGACFCISADIARLESWEQCIVCGDNIKPEAQQEYVESELFQNQMMCEFLSSKAPESQFPGLLRDLDLKFRNKTGYPLWRLIDNADSIISSVSRFCSTDQDGYVQLAKRVTKAFIERMDVGSLKSIINGRVETAQMGSISMLSAALSLCDRAVDWNKLVSFMKDVNYIRQADAHLMSSADIENRIMEIQPDLGVSWVEKGARLIEHVNTGLCGLVSALDKKVL